MLIEDYLSLINALLDERLAIEDFERCYLDSFKNETRPMTSETFQILDGLFGAVDAYCGDDELRDEDDLDEAGLLAEVRRARNALSRASR